MQKILVVLGPTSTGKTDLALQLAKKFAGELVACDSRQVYKGLNIGTGKDGAKAWMYDVADPKKQYTVYNFVQDANWVIDDIEKRGKLPIIVGGTGLYLKALLEGLPNLSVPIDQKLRKQLNNLTIQQLQQRLQETAPGKWESMNNSDRQNPRRLIRIIEISIQNSKFKIQNYNSKFKIRQKDILKIGLTAPRNILYQRIDERVVSRIKQGMVNEAERLHQSGLSYERMKQLGLEYGALVDYLAGKITNKQELIKVLQGKIHGYARRQITWFKKEKNVFWFDVSRKNYRDKVENLAAKWYDTPITYAAKN